MIKKFYEDCEIFITGGSGVVGKAAIEKLLRSANVKKIYILLRCKKGVSTEDRLEEMKNAQIFNMLKLSKPNELDKLVAIPGDTTLDGLGISEEHKKMMKNVSVFFHSAATTRFDEPLRTAIRLNVKSTLESLKLAETLRNLKIFIHVSTFFSNPYVDFVQNKVYPAVFNWRTAIKMLDSECDKLDPIFEAVEHKVITSFPNTYLFTKHLAEDLVNEYRSKLPVGIFRPSIVVSSMEEPEPGFTETTTGIMGMAVVWGAGLMQVLHCKKDLILDLTPLDLGTKYLLIFAVRAALLNKEKMQEEAPVGIFSSRGVLDSSMPTITKYINKAIMSSPYDKSIWIPNLTITTCPFIRMLYVFFLQLLPAFLIDVGMRILGQEPFLMKIQRRIHVTAAALHFFVFNNFNSDGPTDLKEVIKMSAGTSFDISNIEYICKGDSNLTKTAVCIVSGCRKFLLNEDDSSLPRSRKMLKMKKIAYNILKCAVLYVVGCAIYRRVMAYLSV